MGFAIWGLQDAAVCLTGVVLLVDSVLFTILAFGYGPSLSFPVMKRSRFESSIFDLEKLPEK